MTVGQAAEPGRCADPHRAAQRRLGIIGQTDQLRTAAREHDLLAALSGETKRLQSLGNILHPLTKLAALMAMPVLKQFRARLDHRRYSGGALLGLRGLVFKAHGSSDAFAFEQALNRAYDAASHGLLERAHDLILETLAAAPAASGDTKVPDTTLSE